MSYLLDTNVISEVLRPRPDPRVTAWFAAVDEAQVFLSVISLAEIRHGIERLPVGARRIKLEDWLDRDLPKRFAGRLFLVDDATATHWGQVMAETQALGRSMSVMDAFIAATARQYRLTLVTRNTVDFQHARLPLLNPWDA